MINIISKSLQQRKKILPPRETMKITRRPIWSAYAPSSKLVKKDGIRAHNVVNILKWAELACASTSSGMNGESLKFPRKQGSIALCSNKTVNFCFHVVIKASISNICKFGGNMDIRTLNLQFACFLDLFE